jgi:Zn-dependent protease
LGLLPSNFNPQDFFTMMAVLIIAITLHEAGHAYATDWCGDDTPRMQGRLSINPIDHLDPFGSVMMVISSIYGIGIGWGRAVQFHPFRLKHPRWDILKIAIAGPATNVIQALLYAFADRVCQSHNIFAYASSQDLFLTMGVKVNIALVLFNLIPVPPLDGSKVLSVLLPTDMSIAYDSFMMGVGRFALIILVFSHATDYIIGKPVEFIYQLLLGPYA